MLDSAGSGQRALQAGAAQRAHLAQGRVERELRVPVRAGVVGVGECRGRHGVVDRGAQHGGQADRGGEPGGARARVRGRDVPPRLRASSGPSAFGQEDSAVVHEAHEGAHVAASGSGRLMIVSWSCVSLVVLAWTVRQPSMLLCAQSTQP